MNILSELTKISKKLKLPVETGIFSDIPPDSYIVLTPLSDSLAVHADNMPEIEIPEVRLSLFCKGNYLKIKKQLSILLLKADMVITNSQYIGHEDDTGYHHYAIDVAKPYELEE